MNAAKLTATIVALVSLAAQGQEVAVADNSAAALPAAAAEPEPLWTALEPGTLLPQLNAVLASLRGRPAEEPEPITVDDAFAGDALAAADNDCDVMPNPGSRIRAERCFVTTEAEKALNKYQFDEELRFSRQEADRKRLEEASRALQNEAVQRASRRP